jgi:hypothetical protein
MNPSACRCLWFMSNMSCVLSRKFVVVVVNVVVANFVFELSIDYKYQFLLGNIFKYQKFNGYNYKAYENDVKNKNITRPVVKVWTGR